MWTRSAVKSSESGVPTVMSTARAPFAAAGSVEAGSLPAATPLATRSFNPGSGMGSGGLHLGDHPGVGVDADHGEAALGEDGGDDAADVAEADDGDVGLGSGGRSGGHGKATHTRDGYAGRGGTHGQGTRHHLHTLPPAPRGNRAGLGKRASLARDHRTEKPFHPRRRSPGDPSVNTRDQPGGMDAVARNLPSRPATQDSGRSRAA